MFYKQQNRLFALYLWTKPLAWFIALTLIFSGSASGPQSKIAPFLLWAGILLLAFSSMYRYFAKLKLESKIWEECGRIFNVKRSTDTKTYKPLLAGPVVKAHAFASYASRAVSGEYKSLAIVLQDISITHKKDLPGNNDPSMALRLYVIALKLPEKVPHIFIASKNLSRKKLNKPSNLWALTQQLDPSQKMTALEGNFGEYFDVYTPHLESDGLTYEKEIDTLRVLTPDVMLALRDEGFNFHYELYEDHLYVIVEPNILTAAELEQFVAALDAAMTELIPQLIGHKFRNDNLQLNINSSSLDTDIFLGRFVQPAIIILIILFVIFLGSTVGYYSQ